MKKYVILVAGHEYHYGRTNIASICKRRANYILNQNSSWQNDSEVNFILFDVKNGNIDKGTPNSGRINWQTIDDTFEEVDNSGHYTSERHFIKQDTNVISITDAYEYIQNIGETHPRTVYEFSIVGHGWRGGPVLVNSYQRSVYQSNGATPLLRDPWDKDGRRKDTNVANMLFEPWLKFVRAFNEDAHVWVWGCAASRLYKKVIQKVLNSPEFRSKRYGRHLDTDTFNLSFSQDFADEYFSYDPLFFFRSRTSGAITNRSFTRTLREVKDFLIRGLCHTYSAQMAYNCDIKVIAALPGTGADYERTGNSNRRVMVVPTNSNVYGYSFSQIVRFYKTYLSINNDNENRNYALYNPDTIRSWKSNS